MQNQRYIRQLLILIALYSVGAYSLALYSAKTVTADNPSSLNSHSFGTRALYQFYGLYFHVQRLETPWTAVNNQTKVLVVTAPYTRRPRSKEARHLQSWLQHGGVMIYCPSPYSDDDAKLPQPADDITTKISEPGGVIAITSHSTPLLTNVNKLIWHSNNRLVLHSHTFVPIVNDVHGCLAAVAKVGNGEIIALADSQFVSNKNIAQGDNAIFAYNLVAHTLTQRDGLVTFDEYHHGVGFAEQESTHRKSFLAFLWRTAPSNLHVAFGIAIVILVLMALNGNRVLGPKYELQPPIDDNSRNIVRGVATLMRRAGADSIALEVLTADLKDAVIDRFDLDAGLDLLDIVAVLRRQHSPLAEELGTLFVQLSAAAASPPRDINNLLMQLERMRRMVTVD